MITTSRFRRILSILVIFAIPVLSIAAAPEWVESFGSRTPYPTPLYFTGFGTAARPALGNDAEALEAAKTQAKADLIAKIRVQVTSRISSTERSGESRSSLEATAVSESMAGLDIEHVEYDIERNLRNVFALARVSRRTLAAKYRAELDAALALVGEYRTGAKRLESEGDHAAALRAYANLSASLQNAYRISGILETVLRDSVDSADPFPLSVGSYTVTRSEFHSLGAEIVEALERMKYGVSRDLASAMDLLVVQLAEQEVPRGAYRVANLVYQDSDYSSAFGAYAAEAIGTTLGRSYRAASSSSGAASPAVRVVRGSYWIDDETISLRLLFQTVAGTILGTGTLSIPTASVPESIELAPRNAEEALVDQRAIAEGAVVDGGISVEVWTHRGRNEDRLVFTEGDTVGFYFRVNQPCFLQITYLLASGEKVLLDESFYIGLDRVNMAVRYPVEFEAVAPFGVERLIVTAYEVTPPKPAITVKRIEGYDYQVFGSVESIYSATRGLVPKSDTDPSRDARVGEVSLTLTTAAKARAR